DWSDIFLRPGKIVTIQLPDGTFCDVTARSQLGYPRIGIPDRVQPPTLEFSRFASAYPHRPCPGSAAIGITHTLACPACHPTECARCRQHARCQFKKNLPRSGPAIVVACPTR